MDLCRRLPKLSAAKHLTTTYGGPSDYYLRRAIFFGERHDVSCIGLTGQTWHAIGVVAQEFPNVSFESIMLARNELERQLDGRQSDEAMARYRDLPAVDLTTRQRKNTQKRL
jgi:hypothetical protein